MLAALTLTLALLQPQTDGATEAAQCKCGKACPCKQSEGILPTLKLPDEIADMAKELKTFFKDAKQAVADKTAQADKAVRYHVYAQIAMAISLAVMAGRMLTRKQ